MGKISIAAKNHYLEKVKEYKETIDKILTDEKEIVHKIKSDENDAGYKRLNLAEINLNIVSCYILMNSLSLELLGVKNEAYLNDARKGCYKSIIYLEEVVTNFIDAPFAEYKENLEKIKTFKEAERWKLICKLGYSIQTVIEGLGENSKWKWSFVEIEGRYATITKNLLDYKTLIEGIDPRAQMYEERIAHLRLTKRLLQQAADRYREKYELSTLRMDDFKLAIRYLSSLKMLHNLLGESEENEIIKKKIDIWKDKMETDSKKSEQNKQKLKMQRR